MKTKNRRAIPVTVSMFLLLCPLYSWAQVQAPTLGFAFDAAVPAIRPVRGIPGAARIGEPLEVGIRGDAAAVATRPDYVLAVSSDGRVVQVREAAGGTSVTPIEGVAYPMDRIVLSPSGSVAGLIRGDGLMIQLVGGLTESPHVQRTIEVPPGYGSLTLAAVSDDGESVLATFSGSTSAFLIKEDEVRPIGVFGRVSAMEFLHDRHDVLVADEVYNQVHLVQDVGGLAGATLLAGSGSGIAAPVAVRASEDNRRFFVANGGSPDIIILEGSNAPVRISCACQPTGLNRMRGNAVFGLTALSEGPIWVFDGDRTTARIVPIPPPES